MKLARITAPVCLTLLTAMLLPSPVRAISYEELIAPYGSAEDYMGHAVASAGDFNGDGYDDVIVGSYGAQYWLNEEGSVRLYFGGPINESTTIHVFPGLDSDGQFGMSVSAAGDFNSDGYDDFIVGAPQADAGGTDRGRAYIFYGGAVLDTIPDLTLNGYADDDYFGISVAGVGDMNGDGHDDVIVGAYGDDAGSTDRGRVYVYYGGYYPNAGADAAFSGTENFGDFGHAVAAAGDVNGDGFADVIVGARRNDNGGLDSGCAYLYFGETSPDNTADMVFDGAAAADYFGASVSSAGDMNSDGYDDIVVGAQRNDAGGSDAGRAYIYFCGPVLDDSPDIILTGQNAGDYFGIVSNAGDVNGDGGIDLIIGAPLNDFGGGNAGQAYVFFGGAASDTTADLIFTGEAGNRLGSAVAGAGNFDDDNHCDIVIGAPEDNTGGVDAGRAHVYSIYPYRVLSPNGGETWIAGEQTTVSWLGHDVADIAYSTDGGDSWSTLVSSVGGLNRNNWPLIVPLAHTDYALVRVSYSGQTVTHATSDLSDDVFRITPPVVEHPHHLLMSVTHPDDVWHDYRHFGRSIAGVGDVNGDGYGDVVVGSVRPDGASGRIYLYLYGPSADDVVDFWWGNLAMDGYGCAVSSAGDFNGDGYGDFMAGAPGSSYQTDSGLVTLVFGKADPITSASDGLLGPAFGNFGASLALAGDLNDDGYDDLIVGAPKADGGGTERGQAYIYFGGNPYNTTVDLTLSGLDNYGAFGCAAAGAGDVNADGYDDVIVGAKDAGEPPWKGKAFVFYGGPGLDSTADLVMAGADTNYHLGAAVAGAGDVNGDGYDDFAIGSPDADLPNRDPGRVYVYFGGPLCDNIADIVIEGEATSDFFGVSIACGDANGDGFSDLLVGAYANDGGAYGAGRTYLYFGGALMDAEVDLAFSGDQLGAELGWAVALSDVNGDEKADIMIGAPGYQNSKASSGRAYLYELNNFHILAPNGGETWHVGTNQTVTWLGSTLSDIWLSADGGAYWELLEVGVGGEPTNSLPIFVPNRPTHYALIKVANTGEPYFGADKSDTLFTINASIVTKAFTAEAAPDDGRGVLISWETDPGPEDLAGYRLEKKFALPGTDEDWTEVVALTRQTSYHDEEATSGTRYRLNAINGLGFEYVLGETAFGSTAVLAAWPLPYRGGDLTVSFATAGGLGGGDGKAQVKLYDVAGRCVRTLADGSYPPGYHMVTWDGRGDAGQRMASGVYFLQAKSGAHEETRKVVIVR